MARFRQKKNNTTPLGFHFDETDWRGENSYIDPGLWDSHILKPHPYMQAFEDYVKATVLNPDFVAYEGKPNQEIRITHALGRDYYKENYLWVPMKKVGPKCWKVKTAYFVPEIKETVEKMEWARNQT